MSFKNMEEFWPFYLKQHSKPATKRWHFMATLSCILCLLYAVAFNGWFVFLMPVLAYSMAWYSHFFVEGNVPLTFGNPVWALRGDLKMFGLMLTGQMDKELKRVAKKHGKQVN
ncbi:putative 2-hydroxy-palmitic acid dioxygenase Mpo1 [Helianthus annuus]|uniref:DUF962 domain-containing protein n=2 Tax=Helianthus annuus TaxID=4232 RepID=A0A251SSK1_HELAN|nr:hypothetical protein HanXRQr2_Chr13g0591971 [Helianthus annuus]KAJ0477190.1 putative 2-hydroxy-palmitic acid dioxygenase Mpo1 [Helianthus annuus]KAJ0481589.1 putative 2-hydroxy-palmitic acid dioxygenase Mpo1 [Helianthus annuus]KAJ0498025.1 putative 2-hydroxy-palmitic acid dioxygenase Mpo1 [Helianthus annuus]KAJ0664026.1 putative 2-hydroxy-palmitic acid dioxygenase Mpo1 [Helianthus annuus]